MSGLTFAAFAAVNRDRCESPEGFGHPLSGWSLSDWMFAATGEFGEAANVAKKLNRVRDGIPGNTRSPEQLRADLADEFADAFTYLDLAAQSQGIDLGEAVASRFNRKSEEIGAPHRIAIEREARAPLEARVAALESLRDKAIFRLSMTHKALGIARGVIKALDAGRMSGDAISVLGVVDAETRALLEVKAALTDAGTEEAGRGWQREHAVHLNDDELFRDCPLCVAEVESGKARWPE